jgi:CHAT domain-containing protein/tetratricopeptide (TPR) repeat protein
MDPRQLATALIASDVAARERLLRSHASIADSRLARELHAIYQETRTGDAPRAAEAATTLELLSRSVNDPEIAALAAWTSGMAAIHLDGHMERGVALLEEATRRFEALGRPLDVAATRVSMVQGLAMLGRYEEAIACGVAARDTFDQHGDLLAAGKIDQNLGNINYRRGRFLEAEALYRSARERYLQVQDSHVQLAQIEGNLGTVLVEEHRFADARAALEQAIARAEQNGLEVTHTDALYNLGCLGLFQGRYDRALEHLERARRAYVELHIPARAAEAQLEMVDAYLELNMAAEAAEIASRLTQTFAELGMRAERARALGSHGRALGLLGQSDDARRLLAEASELYAAEGNRLEAAYMTLIEAQLLYAEGNYQRAADAAMNAEGPFLEGRTWGRLLLARWLRGEALRAAGQPAAQAVLESTLADAGARELSQITYRCLTSLGLLAQSVGDAEAARRAFEASVAIIETLRAPLPAEEFRAAFLSDKLTPFSELARLNLANGTPDGAARAFEYVERARSRALVDLLEGVVNAYSRPRDAFEADLLEQLAQLREELQWYYSQINRADAAVARAPEATEELYAAIREREAAVLDIRRRIEQRGGQVPGRVARQLDVARLQCALGQEAALVEYFSLDGQLLAFLVTDEQVEVIRDLGREHEVESAVARLRFQIDTLRFAGRGVRRHAAQLTDRARRHLADLYETLLQPIERRLGDRRLIIVPHRSLHYVPFHALHDGTQYVIQRRSVSYAPSAGVLLHCLELPHRPIEQAVLVGVADEQIPRVRDEVTAIAEILPASTVLLDGAATAAAVRDLAPRADVLHLACHGQFRPDNPLFSSLHLGDGWMTVRDAYELDLGCALVTLSACETGVSAVAPGEELMGLARGFFSAGTASLLVSLWTVDDASTAELMTGVYRGLRDGLRPADALARSQRELIERYGHPYYWSAFAVHGRW